MEFEEKITITLDSSDIRKIIIQHLINEHLITSYDKITGKAYENDGDFVVEIKVIGTKKVTIDGIGRNHKDNIR